MCMGPVFASASLVAFWRPTRTLCLCRRTATIGGYGMVTERSGKKSWVTGASRVQVPPTNVRGVGRCIDPALLLGTVYYQQQRDKGKAHQAAVRALAFTRIRILSRCWQDRTPYDASAYLQALN